MEVYQSDEDEPVEIEVLRSVSPISPAESGDQDNQVVILASDNEEEDERDAEVGSDTDNVDEIRVRGSQHNVQLQVGGVAESIRFPGNSVSRSVERSPNALRLSGIAQRLSQVRQDFLTPRRRIYNASNNEDLTPPRSRGGGFVLDAEESTNDDIIAVPSSSLRQPSGSSRAPITVDLEEEENNNHAGGNNRRNADEMDEQEQENENDDREEGKEPPQKMPRLEPDTSVRTDMEDDGFICQICYESFTNSGPHRVCCLKCGHIYGKECIERWIQTSKRCPSCNSKAMKKDVRILYVKNLKVMDTSELDKLKAEIDKVKIENMKIELSNSQLRCKDDVRIREYQRLQTENDQLKREIQRWRRKGNNTPEVIDVGDPAVACSSKSESASSSQRSTKLTLLKHFDIKEGSSRVGAYNEWLNLFVVSHIIANRLFPTGTYGIKKINSLEMKASHSFPIHQKALRDMAFCSLQTDLLLTVGLDKKAVLFNCNSNCSVQTFTTPTPLWSCCWNSVNQNIFYVGGVNGLITSYDIRAPREALGTIVIPTADKTAVGRLKFVSPAYQNQSFNMSGLLVQKLNSVWFAEMLGGAPTDEPRCHQLPLEGPFLNVDFEERSRHVLVSSRPKTTGILKTGSTHSVCLLEKRYSTEQERDLFSCDVVQNFTGGFQEAVQICRSSLFSPEDGQMFVAANGENNKTVRVWDASNSGQKSLLKIKEDAALDFIPGRVNDTNFLGVISQKALDVYDIK